MTLAILVAVFALVLAPSSAQGPIFGTITGPNALAPSQVSAYNLTINGGPTVAGTYPGPGHPTGGHIAGGPPHAPQPGTTTRNPARLTLKVTPPASPGAGSLLGPNAAPT